MDSMYLDMDVLPENISYNIPQVYNYYMDNNELIDALKKENEILKKKNTILYNKKKNISRTNLRLRNKLVHQSTYIMSIKQNQIDIKHTKFKPILYPIPEVPNTNIEQNKPDTEWDYIENDEIKNVSV